MARKGVLTEMQEKFCTEYVVDGHGTYAAIRAGAESTSAAQTASKWLKMGKVRARLDQLRASASQHTGVSLERTLKALGSIAHVDPADMYDEDGDLLPINKMPKHVRMAIEEITTDQYFDPAEMKVITVKKVKLAPRTKATDQIMKHLGGYEKDNLQKQDHIKVTVSIVDDEPETPTDASDEDTDD